MKVAIYIILLFASTSIYACDSSQAEVCNTVQIQHDEFTQQETDDCCSEFCFCNCCNHVSVLGLIINQNNCENNSTSIIYHSSQNLSGYSSSKWQPPKI
mgnify:FL=1